MTDAEDRQIRGSVPDLPPLLTEEEAERKANMIKAASEVAEAVDEMKKNLESRGWSLAEQAALTLFNTMLMTAFGEQMKNRHGDNKKRLEDIEERIKKRAVKLAKDTGFLRTKGSEDVLITCMEMIIKNQEQQAGAVWESFHGEGTKGVLFSIAVKARDDIAKEIEKEEELRG